MTQAEKADAVLAAFRGQVQCHGCGLDYQEWLIGYLFGVPLCVECNYVRWRSLRCQQLLKEKVYFGVDFAGN